MSKREIIWLPSARRDVRGIVAYIARDNIDAARRWRDAVLRRVELAAEMPRAGRKVPEIGRDDVFEVLLGNYRIIYRIREDRIELMGVIHARRRFPTDLVPPESNDG